MLTSSLLAVRRCIFVSNGRASRFSCCFSSSLSTSAGHLSTEKNSLVFMGSPQVSALVLDKLFDASQAPDPDFEIVAIVTQPPARRERGKKIQPSAVAQRALDRGFPNDRVFTPEKAGEESFLSDIKALAPGLCVTVAYGNILTSEFLKIPLHGTVNIHPSLLPLYRGAAPVQRALQDGITETGVTLAYTVRALDAGPIISRERVKVDDYIKAPELLETLFYEGSKLLIQELPHIFDGSAKLKAQEQDHSKATLAPKLKQEESWLSFDQEAFVLHNKVRAFSGWPGTKARLEILGQQQQMVEAKIVTTRFRSHYATEGDMDHITLAEDALIIPCAGQSALEVTEIQLPGKKVTSARAFWNGLRGQKLKVVRRESPFQSC